MKVFNNKKKKNYNEIKLVHVKCDLCNSDNNQTIIRSKDFLFNTSKIEFNIVKCLDCNLVFTNPRLNKEDLNQYYSKILNYDNRPEIDDSKSRFDLLRRVDILTDYFNYPLLEKNIKRKIIQFPNYLKVRRKWLSNPHIPKYINNGKILDIGCAFGGFIHQLKLLRWNVKGIELNKEAVNHAKEMYGLNVENISIEDFKTSDSYDIIYLLNVLEHMEYPKKILMKCVSLLKTKGKLIISIPDFSGLEVKLYKRYAYALQVPFHLYHFTPITINNYLQNVGLKKIKIFHLNTDRDLIGPLSFRSLDHPNKSFTKFLFKFGTNNLIRKTLIRFISSIFSLIGKSSRMTIIAKKE